MLSEVLPVVHNLYYYLLLLYYKLLYREDCLMCCPSNKVIKSVSNTFPQLSEDCTETSYATLHKEWYPSMSKWFIKPPFTPYREQPRSTRIVAVHPRPAFSATKQKITLQSVLINKPKFLKVAPCRKIRKIVIPRSMAVEALS